MLDSEENTERRNFVLQKDSSVSSVRKLANINEELSQLKKQFDIT